MTVETAVSDLKAPTTTPSMPDNPSIASLKAAVDVGSMPCWSDERAHVQQLIKDICASYDPIKDGMVVNAVTGHQEDATEQITRIVSLLDAPQFQSSPPFTLQRMAELLTEPFKFYPQNHLAKFLRALERVMLVSSSIDDYGQVSVDIHDVPTVEDGEKIKPDTGIVLTPIPWISEADLKGGPTEEETETDEKEGEDKGVQDGVQDVSVEMADAEVAVETADVSVEMTDADVSLEMTHDVPNDVAEELRQEKEDEMNSDILETVEAKVVDKSETEETKNEPEEEKTEPAEVETAKTESDVKENKEEEKPASEKADKAPEAKEAQETNGAVAESAEPSESDSDREAKRLKTE